MSTIKKYREAHGLTQTQLAELVSVPQAMVSQWESGIRPPSARAAIMLEIVSGGELLARELRPNQFPACFRVALDPPSKTGQDARSEAS